MQVRFLDHYRPAMTSTDHAIDSNSLDKTVTAIIVHHPRRDSWLEYERWLVDVGEACRRFEGYLSTDVIQSHHLHRHHPFRRHRGLANLDGV